MPTRAWDKREAVVFRRRELPAEASARQRRRQQSAQAAAAEDNKLRLEPQLAPEAHPEPKSEPASEPEPEPEPEPQPQPEPQPAAALAVLCESITAVEAWLTSLGLGQYAQAAAESAEFCDIEDYEALLEDEEGWGACLEELGIEVGGEDAAKLREGIEAMQESSS